MKQCLADLNVWLALLVIHHQNHRLAREWFEGLTAGEASLCRFVQLGLTRLLANRTIVDHHALSAGAAWTTIETLLEDERLEFLVEPEGIDTIVPRLLPYSLPTGKLIGDAYLAAFAMAASRRLGTLDQGFRQFRNLDLVVLGWLPRK
jgi:toxin-antitoxin system PIN domain toxin